MVFFRDRVGGALSQTWVKAMVLVVFAGYVAAACFGVTNIQEGLEKRNTANFDSYSVQFYDREEQYFKKYAFTMSLVFSGPNLGKKTRITQFADDEGQTRVSKGFGTVSQQAWRHGTSNKFQ